MKRMMDTNHHKHQASPDPSAAIYTGAVLSVYDYYVLGFSNTFVWQCPSRFILDFYNEYVSNRHLDVGVGTGYFLDKCRFPTPTPTIALMDLNPNSLQVTSTRLQRYAPMVHLANVLEPLNLEDAPFDSISLNYLLHCLPGDMSSKGVVFQHLKPLLSERGVVFGTTILGQGVQHNSLAKFHLQLYNSRKIFSNTSDSLEVLESILKEHFQEYLVRLVGCVAFSSLAVRNKNRLNMGCKGMRSS
jgi:ubiquinone/menaquinone biosynthesis C-methylase UbiE